MYFIANMYQMLYNIIIIKGGNKMSELEENDFIQTDSKSFISKTFLWMFLGLLVTGIISVFTYNSGLLENIIYSNMFAVIAIIEIVVVLVFSLLFRKLSATAVSILYFVYAILNGFGLSVIFATFQLESVYLLFFVSALVFGIFAFIGYKTKFDLTKVGNILFALLLAGVIISIINLFLGNTLLDIILSWFILILFFGITAYDMQRIKHWSQIPRIRTDKRHIYAAMEIYLDFINIFIRLLSIFGKRK
jgi:hypothetical protein BACCOPRO_03595